MILYACSNDVSSGVRASAAAVVAAEQGLRQGAQYLDLAVKNAVIPTVKKKVPAARGEFEQGPMRVKLHFGAVFWKFMQA